MAAFDSWTRNDMILFAYKQIGLPPTGQTLTTAQYNEGADSVNMAIEELHNEGLALLQIEEDSESISTASKELDADVEDLLKVWVENDSNDHETFMTWLTKYQYYNIADKESAGTPYECYLEYSNPRTLYLWPVPSSATTIKFLKVSKIPTLTASNSTPTFEKRYYAALVYKLAEVLANMNSKPMEERAWIRSIANTKIKAARAREIRSHTTNTLIGAY